LPEVEVRKVNQFWILTIYLTVCQVLLKYIKEFFTYSTCSKQESRITVSHVIVRESVHHYAKINEEW